MVWVLMSKNLCMGVFRTREAAEAHADMILGPPAQRQYEDWVGPWRLEDDDEGEDEGHGECRYVRETDAGPGFALERMKVTE